MKCHPPLLFVVVLLSPVLTFLASDTVANGPDTAVFPQEKSSTDVRLGDLKDPTVGVTSFTPNVENQEVWEKQLERIRRRTLVATGLWPMPIRTPNHAVVHNEFDFEDIKIACVYLESYPGHFVTGNLYRPKNVKGKLPAVLSPYGHWPDGRFGQRSDKEIRQELFDGEERFEVSGRNKITARCVQLARMGCIVFQYDMVGVADSCQLKHREKDSRLQMNTMTDWGLFSPQAELRLQNLMGLQTYNSKCALDWFSELPEVDTDRLAMTGCSGGGTQTFMLAAIDPRVKVSVPAVMVSNEMQGGCVCENAPYLRIEESNSAIAAAFVPRPMLCIGANDWTQNFLKPGYGGPEIRSVYQLYGAEENFDAKVLLQFGHNYNYVSRGLMYHWMNKHLKLGLEEPILGGDHPELTTKDLTVWDEKHPKPAGGDDYERDLCRYMTKDSEQQIQALVSKSADDLPAFRKIVGGAWDIMLGRTLAEPGKVTAEIISSQPLEAAPKITIQKLLVRYNEKGEEVPCLRLQGEYYQGHTVLWVTTTGKAALFDVDSGQPIAPVQKLLDSGCAVVGLDMFNQGELTGPDGPRDKVRFIESNNGYNYGMRYTTCGNYPVFSRRVHDILSVVSWLRDNEADKRIDLVGLEGAGRFVAAARTMIGSEVTKTALDTAGFRFASLNDLTHLDFLPGAVKYLDLPGVISLCAPYPLWLSGESTLPEVTAAVYEASDVKDAITLQAAPSTDAIDWLLQ